jgi:hypothetical protein
MSVSSTRLETLVEEHCEDFWVAATSNPQVEHKVSVQYNTHTCRVFFNPHADRETLPGMNVWRDEIVVSINKPTVKQAVDLIRDVHVYLDVRPELVKLLGG